MASIKKLDTRKFKITVSNGYRSDGRKISRAKTITVPNSVGGRGILQYVAHEAEEFEKLVKSGYCLCSGDLHRLSPRRTVCVEMGRYYYEW